ncbi:hypothetical protein B0H63DRAFT_557419 [Podospora didyma]|uniref:Uncharacterized protein n=1 Tax=Podospora didyma TaxID=330526 RepID=A0AAE0NZA4_9PEZI|nr:hypothetical protein B0H63DRAFT_557419 [Podospora didyma]
MLHGFNIDPPVASGAAAPRSRRPTRTEAALKVDRRRAPERLREAQRAEQIYRSTKRSAAARSDRAEARIHFTQAIHHFKRGISLNISVIKNVPYVLREKEMRRQKAEQVSRQRATEKQMRLDEKLGKEKESRGSTENPQEGERAEDDNEARSSSSHGA